ncbi:MAG: O-antigen ligase family protein [Planctomycetota bacterium]
MPAPAMPPGLPLLRYVSAALAAWLFLGGAFTADLRAGLEHAGLQSFGRPPELVVLWLAAAAGFASAILRSRDRLAVARCLALALLATTLIGQKAVPADAGGRLLVLALCLAVAAPALRASGLRAGLPAALALVVLLCSLPGLFGTRFPQGVVLWLGYVLPPAGLAFLLPTLFSGPRAWQPVWVIVAGTGLACLGALASYPLVAHGLNLPLETVLGTRLRPLGLHPNLAVPHLAVTMLLGGTLLLRGRRGQRGLALLALLPTLGALAAVASRTALLSVALGALLLLCGLSRWRLATWAARLLPLGVALALLLPLSGLTDPTIGRASPSMLDKAVSFRSGMWSLGRATFEAAPWYGNGPGTLFLQGQQARPGALDGLPQDDHPHSVVLAVGEAFGWPGLLALALLFLASLRLPPREALLAQGCRAALLALWAGNAIDLGGAQDSLYPSMVFVLLGLWQAGRQSEEPAHIAAAAPSRARGTFVLAGVLAAVGLWLAIGNAAPSRDAAQFWRPFDPAPIVQTAQAAAAEGDFHRAAEELQRARKLMPEAAPLTLELAQMEARLDLGRESVRRLAEEALRQDPRGPQAYRAWQLLAAHYAFQGARAPALGALAEASLLYGGALADLPRSGHGALLALEPAGPGRLALPLSAVQHEMSLRRTALEAEDPSAPVRLRLREVEILQSLDEHDLAEQTMHTLLADSPTYLMLRLAQSDLARDRIEAALPRFRELAQLSYFWLDVCLLDALSRAPQTQPEEFERVTAQALLHLRHEADVLFSLPSLQQFLGAQQRWAERQGDAVQALAWADALAFSRR